VEDEAISCCESKFPESLEGAYLGSTLPLLVAPGKPAKGVKPIDVSQLFPFFTAQALAPDPRWRMIKLVSLSFFPTNSATLLVINE
jgi:hypothetical protein